MTWPKSICPKCDTEYYGWAFGNPGCHVCSKCGAKLIVEDGRVITLGNLVDVEEIESFSESSLPS